MTRFRTQNGVTLLEVVIATAVASLAIVGTLYMFPKVKILAETANHKVAAIKACESKLEALINAGFPVIVSGQTQEAVTLDSGKDLASTNDDLRAVLTTNIWNIVDGTGLLIAKKILVKCEWNEHYVATSEYADLILYRNIP